ncbi:MAG: leucyl aminopeptidase [Elusimicrobia bacterium]|nr:leucyl aminopeptidase [Elusimicrobiota bacterium]
MKILYSSHALAPRRGSRSTPMRSSRAVAYLVYSEGEGVRLAGGALESSLLAEAREDGFTGKSGTLAMVRRGGARVLFVGMGKREDVDGNVLRLAAASVVRHSIEAHLPDVQFVLPDSIPLWAEGKGTLPSALQALSEGAVMGAYCFDAYKSKKGKRAGIREIVFGFAGLSLTGGKKKIAGAESVAGKQAVARGVVFGEAVNFARDLINRPPSDKRPAVLAAVAKSLAGQGVSVRVYGKAELKRMGAHALLGVNRGSAHPPALIHFRYRPSGKAKGSVVFVGKGVTFDSGGLSLKPADGMMTMKYDMAGAATVFALFQALPRLNLSVEVHGVAVLTENMPGPDAYKPGDVVKALNGKTIEVLNTDAEGRVILADALSFASSLKADVIIDVATLTGAASVALGKAYAALMSNSPPLEKNLLNAGARAGEKMWPLPLEKSYLEHIQSKVADFKNIGNPGRRAPSSGGFSFNNLSAIGVGPMWIWHRWGGTERGHCWRRPGPRGHWCGHF